MKVCFYSHTRTVVIMRSLYYWVLPSLDIPDRGCPAGGQDLLTPARLFFLQRSQLMFESYKDLVFFQKKAIFSILSKRGGSCVRASKEHSPWPQLNSHSTRCSSALPHLSSFHKGGGLLFFTKLVQFLIYWTKLSTLRKDSLFLRKTGNVFHSGCTWFVLPQFHFFHILTNISVFFSP